jgi:hypoxanthine phosphoribosyltransferase
LVRGALALAKKKKVRGSGETAGHRAGESLRVLISEARLRRRVKQLAREIRRDFPKNELHLVGVLKGSVFFLADLARELRGEVSFDFIGVSSYGSNTDSTGEVKLTKDLDVSIESRTVILVEDILDTGLTLRYLRRLFEERRPKHLRSVVLFDKVERRIADVKADYTGFPIPNEFVVGYGLDFDQRYRNLPTVCILRLPSNKKPKER